MRDKCESPFLTKTPKMSPNTESAGEVPRFCLQLERFRNISKTLQCDPDGSLFSLGHVESNWRQRKSRVKCRNCARQNVKDLSYWHCFMSFPEFFMTSCDIQTNFWLSHLLSKKNCNLFINIVSSLKSICWLWAVFSNSCRSSCFCVFLVRHPRTNDCMTTALSCCFLSSFKTKQKRSW